MKETKYNGLGDSDAITRQRLIKSQHEECGLQDSN